MKRVAVVLGIVLLLPQVAQAEFGLGLAVGGVTGDRFYSAGSIAPRVWENPTGDTAAAGDELLVDMESWWQFGLTGFTTIRDRFGLRFDVAFADVDVDGKVRDPSGASETIQWEQMFIFDMIANATYRLGQSDDSYPYLGLGAALTVASGEGNSLDQTMPGLSWIGGWRISAAEGSWLELFVRGILQWPDWAEEEERLAADQFEGESMIHSLSGGISVGRTF
jgi:hypothetical protein